MFLQCQGLPSVNLLAPVFKVHQRRVDIRAWRKVARPRSVHAQLKGSEMGPSLSGFRANFSLRSLSKRVVLPSYDQA